MTKLKTLKLSNSLRKHTTLRPITRCKTRWSGAFNMLERYFKLKEIIKLLIDENLLDDEFLFQRKMIQELENLFGHMKKFNSVMLKLQSSEIDLLAVRRLFDHTIRSYPQMSSYLAVDADIVHSPEFEAALVAMLNEVKYLLYYYIILFFSHGIFDYNNFATQTYYYCFLLSIFRN